jgi:hypothetical protein
MLPDEQVMVEVNGLTNFAKNSAKTGKGIITNLRFVWFSITVCNFNISVPLILIASLKLTSSSRFGKALYLTLCSGSFKFGFTLNSSEQLIEFTKKLENIRKGALRMPRLTPPLSIPQKVADKCEAGDLEKIEMVDDDDPMLKYIPYDFVQKAESATVAFDKALGLAIERPLGSSAVLKKWDTASRMPLVCFEEM